MSDFEDTNLLYRGPGGEQRKLIDQAKRLTDQLTARLTQLEPKLPRDKYGKVRITTVEEILLYLQIVHLNWLIPITYQRYERRFNRYYKQEA